MARALCPLDAYPRALLAAAAHDLPDARWCFPREPAADDAWADLLAQAHRHRVTGLLKAAADAGALAVTAGQAEQLRAVSLATAVRVLGLQQELANVVGLLAEDGVPSRVLKGAAVAGLDYARPAVRSYADLDVLVRADDFDAAVAALSRAGYSRTLAEPRPGFDRRFDKGTTLVGAAAGYEIDLHRTFVLGPWGLLVDLDELWDDGEPVQVGGRTMWALSRTNRFLHACYHAALGNWPLRLASLRDVAEMARHPGLDVPAVLRRAAGWGVEAVVAAAVADTHRLLSLAWAGPLWDWAAGYVPSRREESRLALHTHSGKTFAAQAVATLGALPRLGDKLAYARALVLPDRGYTEGRHGTMLGRLRYGIAELRRGRGGG